MALRVTNDVNRDVPPELHIGLEHIKDLLDCAIRSMDGAMNADPVWPSLAARPKHFIFLQRCELLHA